MSENIREKYLQSVPQLKDASVTLFSYLKDPDRQIFHITHTDTDGVACAAILQDVHKTMGQCSSPGSMGRLENHFHDYDDGCILDFIEGALHFTSNTLFLVTDISIKPEEAIKLKKLHRLCYSTNSAILIVDHHVSTEETIDFCIKNKIECKSNVIRVLDNQLFIASLTSSIGAGKCSSALQLQNLISKLHWSDGQVYLFAKQVSDYDTFSILTRHTVAINDLLVATEAVFKPSNKSGRNNMFREILIPIYMKVMHAVDDFNYHAVDFAERPSYISEEIFKEFIQLSLKRDKMIAKIKAMPVYQIDEIKLIDLDEVTQEESRILSVCANIVLVSIDKDVNLITWRTGTKASARSYKSGLALKWAKERGGGGHDDAAGYMIAAQ